jgi:putative ABC transport system permease protein
MTEGDLIRGNLARKPVRTALLFVSILIAFLVFGLLVGANASLQSRVNETGANWLAVIDRISVSRPQPYAHFTRVRGVDGVADATFTKWFGGYYRDPRNTLVTFAVDPESFARVNGDDYRMSADAWKAFRDDRSGIVISRAVAERFGLRVGQSVPFFSNIFTNKTTGQPTWPFTIRGVFDGDGYGAALFHHDYFRETATFSADTVEVIYVVTRSPENNDAVGQRIDALFANSANETSTQDERAFNHAALAQFGDITLVVTLVVAASFAAILLVVGNTMALSVRERTREIGVLKTLGFSSGRVMRIVLSESLLLSLSGAALGLALAAGALALLSPSLRDTLGPVSMPPAIAVVGLAAAALFGLATGALPAASAFRLKIIDAFARR